MTKGVLINDIELGYAPISAYHFGLLIRDKAFYNNVTDSHLYLITQRKEITFNNFYFSDSLILSFSIQQEGNPNVIYCSLPVVQKKLNPNLKNRIELRLHNRKNTTKKKISPPFNGTQAFSIQETEVKSGKSKIIAWFSADKLFQKHWKGEIIVDFSRSYHEMLEFTVHYVGKSTEQNICERLSSHSTFQEILMKESPLIYSNIPSNEIMIMLMRIEDNNTIVKWGDESSGEDISKYIQEYTLPSHKAVSSDAEKALIRHLQPQYNKILYNSYPRKNDLINTDFHSVILYAFSDPIKLIYDSGSITGGQYLDERDYISVERK